MADYPHLHHSGRSTKIDALRGIAVMGMIVSHALFFFHDSSNSAFTFVAKFLNATVFTLFVFVFGLALSKWLDVHALDRTKHIVISSLKRAGIIYLLYAATSTVSLLTTQAGLPQLFSVLTLQSAISFTEYMQLFVVLFLLIPLLRPLLRYTRTSLLLTFVIGAFFYLAGIMLREISVPDFLLSIKTLLAGHEDLIRFPVLFYLPVVVWGVWWQHDSDHNTQDKVHTTNHIRVLMGATALTVAGVLLSRFVNIPILNPDIRWPPSVAFLATGLSLATIGLFLTPYLSRVGNPVKGIVSYFGRDALDIWANHLLLLFLYRRFIGEHFSNPIIVVMLIFFLTVATVLLSSLNVTNQVRFPFNITFSGTRRFRKRYALYAVTALALVVLSSTTPSGQYGNFLRAPALTVSQKLPENVKINLSTNTTWHTKHTSVPQSVDLVVSIDNDGERIPINPDLVRIRMNSKVVDFSGIADSDGTLHFTKPVKDISPGAYTVLADINNGDSSITTNPVKLNISEPLLVAWTLDWEGWDAPDAAVTDITNLTFQYPTLKFSHFVNPRMFLPGVVTPERGVQLVSFLNERHAKGDEIAMHLHMQFDLVEAAGITPKTSRAWGLRSEEGYDVPTTEYSPQEFRQIVQFAKSLASDSGLPSMTGYRAGGWFLDTTLLNELGPLGFTYDSSGRDRPKTGAFRTIPWNLPVGQQPYFPSTADQNTGTVDSGTILEIPDNGLSTYELSAEALTARINAVYQGGVLTTPKVLVFVSHPQFHSQEFAKIPRVLQKVAAISQVADRGPAVFMTTAEIAKLWYSMEQ